MASDNRKQEIKILLRDWANFLPSGPQEAFVPVGTAMTRPEESWPLTPEGERRMNPKTYVGETYQKLNSALNRLKEHDQRQFNVVAGMYLVEEAGHRDEDFIRANTGTSNEALRIIMLHDAAIDWLADHLDEADLYVRWPQKATGPRPGQDMGERHEELFSIFSRSFFEQKLPYRQALTNAVFKMVDNDGKPYYTRRHADRIVKGRLKELEANDEAV